MRIPHLAGRIIVAKHGREMQPADSVKSVRSARQSYSLGIWVAFPWNITSEHHGMRKENRRCQADFYLTCRSLTHKLRNNVPVNVGQADIATAELEYQLLVIDAQLMQDSGMNVVDLQRILNH